jgi:hypothetical protein
MRLSEPQLPATGATGILANVIVALNKYLKQVQVQVNGNADGKISAATSASNGPPPANSITVYAAGDFIRNNAPSQTGTAGSMYVILGWLCIAPGKPGTWVACRCATGN